METFVLNMNRLIILLIGIILMISTLCECSLHLTPCPLCYLQRMLMIAIGSALLLNLHFGMRFLHYILAYVTSFLGVSIALKQMSFHTLPENRPVSIPILGLPLYKWSFLIFIASILAISLLICLYPPLKKRAKKFNTLYEELLFCLYIVIVLSNILSLFLCD